VTLSDISIKNPVFAWMLMAFLILFGGIAFGRMGISQMPDVDFPVVSVSVTYEGAAPEIMEIDVVDVIEEAMLTLEGIRSIQSTASQERATITIEFELSRDIDLALQDVQNTVAQVRRELPENMDPPVIRKTNPEDQPIIWVSLSADKPRRELMIFARDHIKDRLQSVSGVGEINLGGFIEPSLRVWVDENKLQRLELTVIDVVNAIQTEHVEVPAGLLETPEKEFNIRAFGEAKTPEDFEKIQIRERGGAPIYKAFFIKDVARVEKGLEDIRRLSRINGEPAIGLGIKKQRGTNAVQVARQVREQMENIRKTLPPGYTIQVNWDSTKYIEETVEEMNFTLVLSAALTAVVCLLFLASWASTFNILLAIPTSIMGTFIFLYFSGFTLNTFTMLGLILGVGIVVDDAIMVLENIFRHREMGKNPIQAAQDGAREITSAAVATTLALIAIFIPVVFMKGVIGRFFFQFGITMSVAVALSLLEALTLTPMRASRFLPAKEKDGVFARAVTGAFDWLRDRYQSILVVCLKNRWKIVIVSLALFVASLFLIPGLRKEFVPPQDQSAFLVRVQTPVGSSLHVTDQKMSQAEAIVAGYPEVIRYFVAVGGFGGAESNRGMLFITLKDPPDRPVDPKTGKRATQQEVMARARDDLNRIPDFRAVTQDLSTRGFTAQRGFPVEFTVRGPDWERLTQVVPQLEEKMKQQSDFFTDVDTDYEYGQPEIQVLPLREAAAARGVRMEDIGKIIQAMIGGIEVGKFTEGGRRNDIRIRIEEEGRRTAKDISKIYVRNDGGELVPLSEVVTINERVTLKNITRRDRERAIGIFANLAPGASQAEALRQAQRLADATLPDGYRIVFSGSAETFTESFQSLLFVLYLGIIVAYMVLGTQYNSFIHPLTVLLALPFSVSGALIALRVTDLTLNIFSLIGLILLMGIVKKNSIMLVDFTNQRREEGLSLQEALLTACPQRLRPILMTSIATMAAAVPPALALGPGAETRIPMAVVVLGGVAVSTLLTLFVVPCAYSLMARLEKKKSRAPIPAV
jgi:HAE1 family hydrophobic/amphiphilic exporter-1